MNESRESWSGRSRLATVDSWISLIGGGALAGIGLQRAIGRRHSKLGMALAAGGGALLYNGLRTHERSSGVHLQAAFTINKPVDEIYRYWREMENLPKFMHHLESVRQLDGRRSQWKLRGPMGASFTWESEIVDESQNRFIVWRSMPGSVLESSSSVEFREAPGGRGTELIVAMHYPLTSGRVGQYLAELLGAVPERVLREQLRNFKQLMEAGEIPTIEGQSSGRRSPVISMFNKPKREPAQISERTA